MDKTPLRKDGFDCSACNQPNSICDLVQCDLCPRWWHQSCVGVTPSVERRPWICKYCSNAGSSQSSSTTTSSRSRRRTLQLQQLEEKRELDRKARELKAKLDEIEAEQLYVVEKYKVLQAGGSSDEEDDAGSILHTPDVNRVKDWVVTQEKGGNQQQPPTSSSIPPAPQSAPHFTTPRRNLGASPKRRSYVQPPKPGPSGLGWQNGSNPTNWENNWKSLSVVGVHQWESLLLQKNVVRMQDPKFRPIDHNSVSESPVIDRTVQDSHSSFQVRSGQTQGVPNALPSAPIPMRRTMIPVQTVPNPVQSETVQPTVENIEQAKQYGHSRVPRELEAVVPNPSSRMPSRSSIPEPNPNSFNNQRGPDPATFHQPMSGSVMPNPTTESQQSKNHPEVSQQRLVKHPPSHQAQGKTEPLPSCFEQYMPPNIAHPSIYSHNAPINIAPDNYDHATNYAQIPTNYASHNSGHNRDSNIDHLAPLITQLGLGPNELPDCTHFLNTYQPTSSQLLARQVFPRDLPTFDGNPNDWPLFISSFTNSTLACGYSPVENLGRLQRCLKGSALESVRSRLHIPESVPFIMETLRFLYGRPELLINALLDKVRSVPAPRAEKLASFIDFGIAVQSLCGYLEAANHQAHLSNPSLLNELVNRLPSEYQYKWVEYIESEDPVDLKTFARFVSRIAKTASCVAVYQGAVPREDKPKPKRGSLNVHLEAAEENQTPVEKLCPACFQNQHPLKECSKFKAFNVDERWEYVEQQEVCRNCLNYHGRRSCRISGRCGVNGCTFRHHPLLHSGRTKIPSNPRQSGSGTEDTNRATTKNPASSAAPPTTPSVPAIQASGSSYIHRSPELTFLFRILPITVYGNEKAVDTFAFVDEGSSITLVEDSLVKELGVEGIPQVLCLQWTGDMTRTEHDSKLVELKVSGPSKNKIRLSDARTVSNLGLATQSLDYVSLVRDYPHLKGLPIDSYTDAMPRILIGVNNLHMTVPLRVKQGRAHEPMAAKTKLGWCIYGGMSSEHTPVQVNYHACSCSQDDSLHKVVRQYFELEDMGIHATTKLESDADTRARQILEESTHRQGERFETGLLWKYDQFEFPDSYPMAFKRYECLEKKMIRNPELRQNLTKQMESYQAKGYAHRITEAELRNSDPRRVWYLPLGVVVNPKKPGKVRMIWDASATVDGISLNTMLLKGPDELAPLPWVLFRFRQFPVAVSGDIAEMFHQIRINKRDRQAQRFLWKPEGSSQPEIYVMDVATFGSACSPASAQYVKNRNAQEFKNTSSRAVEGIIKGHYVDDYADSFITIDEAVEVATDIKSIHAAGGFNIRDWRSNHIAVLDALGEKDTSEPKPLKLETNLTTERVLGMHWLPHEDVLGYSTTLAPELQELVSSKRKPTKREALRCLMSFFDPLGLLAAFVLHGKILLQDVWRAGTQWDEAVGDQEYEKWLRWIEGFPLIDDLQIPRCYFNNVDYDDVQLHIFVDASEDACAAVGYFRVPNNAGGYACALVAAKTKVAPLKHWSIPRLELQAAVMGTRLRKFVEEGHTLSIKRCVLWSDSSTVLAWIRSDHRRYTQFVACRVGEILTNSSISEWRWIPSKQNVADLATKWGQGPPLTSQNAWFCGPAFLKEDEYEWPQPRKPNDTEEELKTARQISCPHSAVVAPIVVVDASRFSKWERILRTVGYVHRYINRRVNQNELVAAENSLFWMAQQQSYPAETSLLQRSRPENSSRQHRLPRHSQLHHINSFLDENSVLRVDSRVGAARNVAMTVRYPVILPPSHRITELIIDFYHRKFLHANFETVVNELRQSFHISKIRTTVKKIIRQCQNCKVYKCKPQVPMMGPLPEARLASFVRPFSYVGLDLFGPILVKRGRSSVKRWVALFTCLTIRAVHVEVVHSLTTESCIMSIRRFVVRRGAPLEIHSDNGTNFRGADNILQQQIGQFQEDLAATFTNTHTKWIFIPPGTPHMGGSWERMVRSVKTAMEKSLCVGRKLDDEALNTFVVEAEGVVNSRPLTYLPLDSEEAESLTSNHFLLGSSNGVKQPSKQFVDEAVALKNTWNQIESQLDMFWRRWVREYLPTLARRTKWFNEVQEIGVGNLVVIVNESKRNGWVRGRVLEVFPGTDGRVRHAIVQTNKGLSRQSVSKLAVLNVEQTGDSEPDAGNGQRHEGEDVKNGNTG
ncbi:uncharacterized protein LOC129752068 [Uranotaenia lowii]|uniref:uncharacterized protein LOC129752068 n=1 Tax=Uranotaenia lowii TaxID=190385 RepID=UPI002478F1AE|nr:uncharacterized protein LOC129752068 [Uranotaenia lowii]